MVSFHSPTRTAEEPEPMIIGDSTICSAERSGVAEGRAINLSHPFKWAANSADLAGVRRIMTATSLLLLALYAMKFAHGTWAF
jgi:hypothetical protein